MSENEQGPVNPHTGAPVPPEEPVRRPAAGSAPSPGAAAAFEADRGPRPADPATGQLAPPAGPGAAPGGPPAAAATLSPQEIAIRAACETVMDPEIGLSVVDLGLIREVRFLDGPKTLVRMMLTTPFCPYAPQLVAEVKQAAESAVPQPCEVEILPDPWSPDLMPDPGLLGFSF